MYLEISPEEILQRIPRELLEKQPNNNAVGWELAKYLGLSSGFLVLDFLGIPDCGLKHETYHKSWLGRSVENVLRYSQTTTLLNPCKQVIP